MDESMKFCEQHFSRMNSALEERGLSGFIASDANVAASRLQSQAGLDGEIKRENFEPLMGMQVAIIQNSIESIGNETFADNPDGSDRCLLCHLIATCNCGRVEECGFQKWITYAANDMVDVAKGLGLVGAS
jgi:hypothetical protein